MGLGDVIGSLMSGGSQMGGDLGGGGVMPSSNGSNPFGILMNGYNLIKNIKDGGVMNGLISAFGTNNHQNQQQNFQNNQPQFNGNYGQINQQQQQLNQPINNIQKPINAFNNNVQ